MFGLTVSWF